MFDSKIFSSNWKNKTKKNKAFRSFLSLSLENLEYRDQPGTILTGLFDQIGISVATGLMDSLSPYSLGISSGESIVVNQDTTQIDALITTTSPGPEGMGGLGVIGPVSEVTQETTEVSTGVGNAGLGLPSDSGVQANSDFTSFMANGDGGFYVNGNQGITQVSSPQGAGSEVTPTFNSNFLIQDNSGLGFGGNPSPEGASGGNSQLGGGETSLPQGPNALANEDASIGGMGVEIGTNETMIEPPLMGELGGSEILIAGPDLMNLDAVGAVAAVDQVIIPGLDVEVLGPIEGIVANPVVLDPPNPIQNPPLNQPGLNANDPVLLPDGGLVFNPGLGGFIGGLSENYYSGNNNPGMMVSGGVSGQFSGIVGGIGGAVSPSGPLAGVVGGSLAGPANIAMEGGLAGNEGGILVENVDGGEVLATAPSDPLTLPAITTTGSGSLGTTTVIRNSAEPIVVRGTEITLAAPEFVRRGESDVVEIQLSETIAKAGGSGFIDRDINQDGDFNDVDETGIKTFAVGSGSILVDFGAEAEEGLYRLRARVDTTASKTTDMTIDWHSGYIGDQTLLETASGVISQESQVRSGVKASADARVLVQVRCTLGKYLDQFQADLKELGMTIQNVSKSQNLVTGTIPQNKIMDLENIANFLTALDAPLVISKSGSVTSQGVAPMNVPSFISQTGADGAGVTVGVISDSASAASIAASQSTGDLPAVVNVLSAGVGSDEGTAMLEIVYDVAPGAGLAFSASGGTGQTFAAAITGLAGAGCRVVVDDIGIASTPFFNDGVVSQAVDAVAAQGVFYASAAGNDADYAYRGVFTNTSGTVGGITGNFQDFGGGDLVQDLNMATGDLLRVVFQWNTAFLEGGSALPNYQVANDFSVLVIDTASGTVLQTFNNDNQATDEALEAVVYQVTNVTTLGMAFQLNTGPAPTQMAWISFAASNPNAQSQGATTIFGQPEANGAVCVGAVNYANLSVPETFTALGGDLEIFYDAQGNLLSTPEIRQKPEISGPDGVSTTVPGFSPFFGTSAAAPHVAGVAALMFSQQPNATLQEVIDHLYATAIPVGANNPALVGIGFVQAVPLQIGGGGNSSSGGIIGNNSANTAFGLGTLAASQSLSNQVIEFSPQGYPLFDWFKWTAGKSGTFSATLSISTPEPLEMNVYYKVGGGLTLVGNTSGTGNLTLSIPILSGQQVYVEVKGFNTSLGVMTTGKYSLTTNIL